MQRLWRVYRRFFVSSFQRELEFRANFWAKVGQNIVWMAFFIMILNVIYRNTDSVAGWTRGDSYVLAATCFLMSAVVTAFFSTNVQEIPEKVRKGTLDFDIVKPIDSQFLISVRKFNFDEVGTLAVGIAMVFIGASLGGVTPGLGQVASYVVLVFCSIAIFYSFMLMLMTLGIWLVRVDNLWVLGDSVFTIARFPIDIFRVPIQRALTYFVPLAFIATVPTRELLGKGGVGLVTPQPAWLYGIVWGLAFLVASRLFWRFALTKYTSASS